MKKMEPDQSKLNVKFKTFSHPKLLRSPFLVLMVQFCMLLMPCCLSCYKCDSTVFDDRARTFAELIKLNWQRKIE